MSDFYSAMRIATDKFRQMEQELQSIRSESLAADAQSTKCSETTSISFAPINPNTAFLSACLTFLPNVTIIQVLELVRLANKSGPECVIDKARRILLPQFPYVLSLFTCVVTNSL